MQNIKIEREDPTEAFTGRMGEGRKKGTVIAQKEYTNETNCMDEIRKRPAH